MKKILVIFALLAVSFASVNAQENLKWGATLGMNSSNFSGDAFSSKIGFHAGVKAEVELPQIAEGSALTVVRTMPEGTPFVTLDGVERKLSDRDLMICDTEKPMCIAGVFGGLDSGSTETTKDVFIESAYFHPTWVRKTARRHGLNTAIRN